MKRKTLCPHCDLSHANHDKCSRKSFAGYTFETSNRGTTIHRQSVDTRAQGDYGADPLGDGRFRMVPSGDIVDFDERNRRLKR